MDRPTVHHGTTTRRAARALLACGAAAGPLYVVSGATQALMRDGFDITRHPLSLLSNGPLGWIHITTFLAAGVLTILGAAGLRDGHGAGVAWTEECRERSDRSDEGRRRLLVPRGPRERSERIKQGWGSRLVALYGLGLIGAGVFVADPMDGFPVGTPPGPPETVTWHGMLHFMTGGIGFIGLIGACLLYARRFAKAGRKGWAVYSLATGVLFTAAFAGIASGEPNAVVNVSFGVAVVLGWAWLTTLSAGRSK